MIKIHSIREIRAPHPGRPKAHNEHCRAMRHAMTEALRRELGNALRAKP